MELNQNQTQIFWHNILKRQSLRALTTESHWRAYVFENLCLCTRCCTHVPLFLLRIFALSRGVATKCKAQIQKARSIERREATCSKTMFSSETLWELRSLPSSRSIVTFCKYTKALMLKRQCLVPVYSMQLGHWLFLLLSIFLTVYIKQWSTHWLLRNGGKSKAPKHLAAALETGMGGVPQNPKPQTLNPTARRWHPWRVPWCVPWRVPGRRLGCHSICLRSVAED